MRLIATLGFLKGSSYVNASASAFLIAGFTWFHRPSLLAIAFGFLAAALGCAMIYQRVVRESLQTFRAALKPGAQRNPELARSCAQLLYLEGRDEEARELLLKHLGESPFID